MSIPLSVGLFVLAGLCEIGGGYLVWLWLREGKPIGYAILGGAILIMYGIIPTFQTAHFGRVYAAYGGMFIVLSLLWGMGDWWNTSRSIRCHRGDHLLRGHGNDHVLATDLRSIRSEQRSAKKQMAAGITETPC